MADVKVTALTAATTPDDDDVLYFIEDGVSKQITVAALRAVLNPHRVVTTDQTNSTVTPAAITDLAIPLAPGTYLLKGWIVWNTAATTTGIGVFLNANGGTVTLNAGHFYTTTTGTTATTGIADQTTSGNQLIESKAWRANNTDPGVFLGTDTAGAVQFAIMEAVVVVTAATTLQPMFRSEVAGSNAVIMAGSALEVRKVA